jgi:hypothetical protein
MNDLALDLRKLTARGARPKALEYAYERDLEEMDLEALATAPRESVPLELKKITERHHALARALASGLRSGEAAALIGYDVSRVSILQNSPAFRELVDLYRAQKDLEFAEFSSRLAGLGKDAIVELQSRLEDEPEKFSSGLLLDLVTNVADRTGFGTKTTQVNINVDLATRLSAARERAREAMRDVTPEGEE